MGSKVFEIKNCSFQIYIKIVITFLLILPFSNCSVERIFSKLKLTKTDLRNKLCSSTTISSLFFAKEAIERNGGDNFEPTKQRNVKTEILKLKIYQWIYEWIVWNQISSRFLFKHAHEKAV